MRQSGLSRRRGERAPLPTLAWHWGRGGGGCRFTFELVRELYRRAELDVEVSAAAGSELDAGLLAEPGVPVHRVRTFSGDKARLSGKLAAASALLRLPIIGRDFSGFVDARPGTLALCTFQSIWDVAAIPALSRRRGRFLFVLHDALFHPGDSYPLRTSVLRRQVAAADGLVVLSEHIGREARIHHGFPADRIWTVPHGSLDFGIPNRIRTRDPARPIRLLFLGRILPYKGLGLLLEACEVLRREGVAFELAVVGSGSVSDHAEAIARIGPVTLNNRWLTEAELGGALDQGDIVVLPYVEASQSGIAAAALTAGVPIVATPVGGLTEQVDHGRTGLVCSAVTAEALAASIKALAGDPDLYAACSRGSLDRARAELGWDRIAGMVAGIAAEVADRPRRSEVLRPPPPFAAALPPGAKRPRQLRLTSAFVPRRGED